MASAYHPFYDTLWNDDKLEGASFEGKAFFAYLFTNSRVRPSGIYRVTDAQLAVDTGLPAARIRSYLADLQVRHLIVRDGAWVFVRSYFKRQPKHDNLLKTIAKALDECSSNTILEAFAQQYPLFHQRVADRLATVRVTVGQPMNAPAATVERIRRSDAVAVTEQYNAVQSTVVDSRLNGPEQPPNPTPAALEQNRQANAIFQAVVGRQLTRAEGMRRLAELFGADVVKGVLDEGKEEPSA